MPSTLLVVLFTEPWIRHCLCLPGFARLFLSFERSLCFNRQYRLLFICLASGLFSSARHAKGSPSPQIDPSTLERTVVGQDSGECGRGVTPGWDKISFIRRRPGARRSGKSKISLQIQGAIFFRGSDCIKGGLAALRSGESA